MKSIKIIVGLALFGIAMLIPSKVNAQESKKYYANGDWQFNIPLSNSFADKASGWGMNFEGGYYFTPKMGIGLFLAYSTNHKYIDTETFAVGDNGTLTTNQQHSMFRLPFGVAFRYNCMPQARISPYGAIKLGTEYAQIASYISTYKVYNNNWGFYMSPEIGTNFWITQNKTVAIHAAIYYSYSTNKATVLNGDIDKLNNVGFRLGLGF